MAAPVGLEEHPGPGHPVAPAPVAGRPPGAGQAHPCRAEDPADRARRGLDRLVLGGRLGEVDRVEARVRRAGELDDPAPGRLVGRVGRGPATVAVDDGRRAMGPEPRDEPADLAGRAAQVRGGLGERQLAGHEMGEDDHALLRPSIQGDLPTFPWDRG